MSSSAAAEACASALPVDIVVPGAIGGPTSGPAAGTVSVGQIAVHWTIPSGVLEVRWPPDERLLYGGTEPERVSVFDSTGETGDERTLIVSGATSTLIQLTLRPGVTDLPDVRPCDRIQVRHIAQDGATETVAYRFGDGATSFDLGPLIGNATERLAPVGADESIECGDRATVRTAVEPLGASATPAEALRAFLGSDAGAALDIPTPPRPFHEYHVAADGTYRYERYTNWNEHEAVTIRPATGGWAATSWTVGTC